MHHPGSLNNNDRFNTFVPKSPLAKRKQGVPSRLITQITQAASAGTRGPHCAAQDQNQAKSLVHPEKPQYMISHVMQAVPVARELPPIQHVSITQWALKGSLWR